MNRVFGCISIPYVVAILRLGWADREFDVIDLNFADILQMNPWNDANASILPCSRKAMGSRHSFPGAPRLAACCAAPQKRASSEP
jgi:hypothetical protein